MKETRFKQTEIGEIPEDWEVKKIGDICITSSGGTPSRNNKLYYVGNIKWFTTSELKDCELEDSIEHISEEALNNSSAKIFQQNTLLMAMYGATIGRLGILKMPAATNQACCAIASKNIDIKYLYYDLLFNRERIISLGSGAGQPNISQAIVKNFIIQIPPKNEAKKIAKSLSDVDNLITSLEKLIEKKKNIKQGTMQQLLTGKKRLPGFAKSDKYKQTEIGKIPEDWEVMLFDDCLKLLPNNTFSRSLLNNSEGIYNNVHYGDILIKFPCILDCSKEEVPFVNDNVKVNYQHLALNDGDIIIADTAEDECVGKVLEIFNMQNKKVISGLHTIPCRPKNNNFAPKWLGYFMNSELYHNQLMQYVTGIKVSSISKASVKKTYICIPSKEEQTAIANILSTMDKEIEALNIKLEKYRLIKQGMMQQLLTGKIRLI